jgi:chromosome partitioning protein
LSINSGLLAETFTGHLWFFRFFCGKSLRGELQMTWTIAVSNQKGGVAKTTSCISIGACLAEAGWRTLIVDFDPQVNLTLTSGFEPEDLDWTLADLLAGEDEKPEPGAVIQHTGMEGLDLLPSDQRLVDLEVDTRNLPSYENLLRDALQPLYPQYDYILIDCPPSMGSLTIMALTAANLALIPVQCDYYATRGLMSLVEIVQAVQQRTNPGLLFTLFVTLYDARPLISRRMLEQLRANFPNEMLESVIGMDTRLRESALANEPVITYAPKSRATAQYRSLATEITQWLDQNATKGQ